MLCRFHNMTPKQQSTAYRLYTAYKTGSREYIQIANDLGMQIGELNRRMWALRNDRESARRARRRSAFTSTPEHP